MANQTKAEPFRTLEVVAMPTSADLSVESFKWAKQLLGDDLPLLLIGTHEQLTQEMADWLWENSRVTMLDTWPAEVLRSAFTWAVKGQHRCVISRG